MTIIFACPPTDRAPAIRCPSCRRPFVYARTRPLPSGIATLSRLAATCPCGAAYGLAYRRRPVANDEERAESVRILREIRRRLREGSPDRRVCEIALSRMEG